MSDKRGQKTGKYKLTFSTPSPPTELPELGSGFLHPLEPYYMNYVRCNKCQKFGHLKRFCKSKTSVCPQCAGKHSYAQCKATRSNRKCANCGLLTHGAAYRGCSAYQQYMRKIDDSNIQIHNAWSLRMAKPSQTTYCAGPLGGIVQDPNRPASASADVYTTSAKGGNCCSTSRNPKGNPKGGGRYVGVIGHHDLNRTNADE